MEVFKNGAKFVRLDCHLHTKADKEFKYEDEENKFLEEEYKKELLKSEKNEEDIEEIESDVDLLKDAYEKLSKESGIDFTSLDEDYEDAFDHIEYLDESFFEEGNLEEMTEEVFPGVRKLKGKSK